MATVSHKVNKAGDHALGITQDGKFVPLVIVDASRFDVLAGDASPGPDWPAEKKAAEKPAESSKEKPAEKPADTTEEGKEG